MRIPVKYNLRSLMVRRIGTLMTAMGIGLTVGVVVVMLAMINGLDSTFTETGREDQLIVLRKGAQNEINSYFTSDLFEIVRLLPGVARNERNDPIAAGELVVVITHPKKAGGTSNLVVRGASEMSFVLRPELKIVEGRRFRSGLRELIVSRSVLERFTGLALGAGLKIHNQEWTVVGIFEADGRANDSEIWSGYRDIAQVWNRPIFSSVLLRVESLQAVESLAKRISDDQRIQLNVLSQKDYFAEQTISSVGLKALVLFIAVIMGIGSSFAIMNMMYGTVMARQQEVATLRALGFRKRSILSSFVMESAALSLAGGLIGCVFATLFNGYSAGTTNFSSFSEVIFNFRITPMIVFWGMAYSLLMGVVGGFFPARRAASIKLIDVLRD